MLIKIVSRKIITVFCFIKKILHTSLFIYFYIKIQFFVFFFNFWPQFWIESRPSSKKLFAFDVVLFLYRSYYCKILCNKYFSLNLIWFCTTGTWFFYTDLRNHGITESQNYGHVKLLWNWFSFTNIPMKIIYLYKSRRIWIFKR